MEFVREDIKFSPVSDASVHDVRLHLVEATVDLAESVAANEEDALYGWFMPRCPRCNTSLSQKLASSRLICLNCGAEYTVKEVSADDD